MFDFYSVGITTRRRLKVTMNAKNSMVGLQASIDRPNPPSRENACGSGHWRLRYFKQKAKKRAVQKSLFLHRQSDGSKQKDPDFRNAGAAVIRPLCPW
jgi:hypothetical protein